MQAFKMQMSGYRSLFIMLFVIFSLSPCRVKETILSVFDIPYSTPLNKTRTTITQGYSCSNSLAEVAQNTTIISIAKHKFREVFFMSKALFYDKVHVNKDKAIMLNYPEIFALRGPPKYILFQQLKVDLV